MFDNINSDVVGMRLGNGNVKVVKSSVGGVGEVFESESRFRERYTSINEGSNIGSNITITILESING